MNCTPFVIQYIILSHIWAAVQYYDVLLPDLKELSSPHAQYRRQLEAANQALLSRYREIKRWNS